MGIDDEKIKACGEKVFRCLYRQGFRTVIINDELIIMAKQHANGHMYLIGCTDKLLVPQQVIGFFDIL